MQRIRVAAGNIGIGTTNPQYKVDVNGIVNMNGILTGDNGTYFPIRHKDFTSASHFFSVITATSIWVAQDLDLIWYLGSNSTEK